MAWSLKWTPGAVRDLGRLQAKEQERIRAKLRESLKNPARFYVKLTGEDTWRLRVGDRRVIVLILFVGETIQVQSIGHRSTVYGR